MVALRLFVPESWTSNPVRLKRAGVRYWWRFRARMMPIRAVPDGISAGDDPVLLDSA